MLFQCWPTASATGRTWKQHWVSDQCLLGISYQPLGCGRETAPVLFTKTVNLLVSNPFMTVGYRPERVIMLHMHDQWAELILIMSILSIEL